MRRLCALWRDDAGAVLSAEAALLGTVGVLGGVVGLNLFATSVNDELREVAYSFRSLDQSYSVAGHRSPTAWTAGSGYTQEPVEDSLAKLRLQEEELRNKEEARQAEEREGERAERGRRESDDGDRNADSREDRRERRQRDRDRD